MHANNIVGALATFGIVVVLYSNTACALRPSYSNEPPAANDSGGNDDDGGGYITTQFNIHHAQLQKRGQLENQREQSKQQEQKYPDHHPNLTYFTTSKTSLISTISDVSSSSTKSLPYGISAAPIKPSLHPAYIYKAEVPTHIDPEADKVVNGVKSGSFTSSSVKKTSYTSNSSNMNSENNDDLSKKIIGSSVVTSVSVILNGDQPEFTDALGQKVPKPKPSLQVSSPIDLLNPDRYEFYTFDDNGELVKRLMTIDEIQSIVANGDGQGPTIIHHGPIEDRDPEKNVQDIVNSVQSVLNKEVASNKNSSTEGLPVFDTPDVSSSWSMILPAVFGNTGNVDIYSHQKPQQIVMTPDTEIIETSTMDSVSTTSKKPKPNKRKPGHKRRSTTTTTEVTPQVIQEELDSQESVYTGMQQYQNLAATMQNYDGFSQLHIQPLYHKLPEIETSTRRVFINNQEVAKIPDTIIKSGEAILNENTVKNSQASQHKTMPPHRVKKPNGSQTTMKHPLANKQKIKRKPTATTTRTPMVTTTLTTSTSPISMPITQTTSESATTTTTPVQTTTKSTTTTLPPNIIPTSNSTTNVSNTTVPKKRKKKPTSHPLHFTSTTADGSTQQIHMATEQRKPSPKPHRTIPKPTKYQHIVSESDLSEEGTVHQSYHKTRPKINKPIHTTHKSITTPTPTVSLTTVTFSPTPTFTTNHPIDVSLIMKDYSGYQQKMGYNEEAIFTTRTTTSKPESATFVNIPSTSGTSGYPVPSYGEFTDESDKLNFNQYKKQPLLSLALTHNENKPYEQDAHTLQSFDQIILSLKQPDNISDQMTVKMENDSEKLLKPVKYESAKNKDELEDTVNKYEISIENNTQLKPSPTLKASHSKYVGSALATILTDIRATIKESNIPTELSETTHIPPENEMEHTTEYNIVTQEYQSHTQNPYILNYTPATANFEVSTLEYDDKTVTDGNQIADVYTEPLKIEVRPNKEETLANYDNYSSHPVFVASLKHQLNMEVIKPSEQITMSDFQTQAATIASTLIDGANADPSEYTLLNSNETRDEISLLMSDVIHQISNTSVISTTKQTNSNDNRFSNQAQLDLSFLMGPTKYEAQKTTSSVPNINNESTSEQNYKPIYERLENTETKHHQSENLHKESTAYFSTTEIPETTTVREFYTEREEMTTEYYATSTEKEMDTKINSLTSDYSMTATETPDKNDCDNNTLSFESNENDTSSQTESDEKFTTLKIPILSYLNVQQQKLVDDREPLFESYSCVDTTTLINILSEETTSSFSEENQSSVKVQENTNTEDIKFSEINVTNKNAAESSENDSQTEITTSKYHLNKAVQEDTQVTTEISWQNAEKFNLVDTETITTEFEMKDLEWTTSINKDSLTTEQSESQIQFNVTEAESYQKHEDTTQLTPLNRKQTEENATVEAGEPQGTEEITTTKYQSESEETSAELSAMISEEDETEEPIYEDPYIKLGETTTIKSEVSLEINTQPIPDNVPAEKKAAFEQGATIRTPLKPINPIVESNFPPGMQPSIPIDNYGQPYEESDEEDEEDQFGYNVAEIPEPISIPTKIVRTTTTSKPKVTTTRRVNTLKPISYFNKHPAYALYQEPAEPIYNEQSSNTHRKENTSSKVVAYSIPTPQQRPLQRPPQLSNLMFSSTQATRPPVKLEPSPNNSQGLEVSLANLDEDILAFAKLCNELAFTYWKAITSEKISSARSLIMSPFALTSMLSMVFLGARGSTSGEMNDVLKLDDMVTFNPHLVFKNITDSVEKSIDSDIATTAFVREIYSDRANGKVLQFFKEKTQQLYAGHVEEVNFHVVNDIIRRRTNLLVKRHTMGKVLEYLRTNSVWVNGPLATISANLFQTDCSHGSTQDRDGEIFFQVHPTVRQRRLIPIPAVLFRSGFTAGYETDLDATVVAFGRIQDTTSVIYIMPGHLSSISPSDNLDRLEKQLMETAISNNGWSNLLTSLMDRPGMEVQIPRFSHRSFINATLGLQKMGLEGLFKSDNADLGGLTGSSNRDIYLSDMIQINTFSTCGEEKIADHHHVEMYPAPPLRKRNKDVDVQADNAQDSSEDIIEFDSLVQDSVLGRGFYDDLLDPKYLELPLPLRPRQARVPDAPRLRFDKPFLYFVRHNPTGMILFIGRFNPRLLP